jgi:hypothetical protein
MPGAGFPRPWGLPPVRFKKNLNAPSPQPSPAERERGMKLRQFFQEGVDAVQALVDLVHAGGEA